jgi:hypothetical protein
MTRKPTPARDGRDDRLIADKPGIFEVELEKKGLKLFELEVK